MGHAGAIVSGGKGGAADKIRRNAIMRESTISNSPAALGSTLFNELSN